MNNQINNKSYNVITFGCIEDIPCTRQIHPADGRSRRFQHHHHQEPTRQTRPLCPHRGYRDARSELTRQEPNVRESVCSQRLISGVWAVTERSRDFTASLWIGLFHPRSAKITYKCTRHTETYCGITKDFARCFVCVCSFGVFTFRPREYLDPRLSLWLGLCQP